MEVAENKEERLQKYNNLPRSFTDNHVDGSILPPTIGIEVDFDPTRDRYVKKDENKQSVPKLLETPEDRG